MKISLIEGEQNNFEKFPKQYRIDLAADQEYLFTKDPNQDIIPKQKLIDATKQVALNKSIDDDNFSWKSIGPSDVAGRVRAIFHHPTSENPNQVIIGSASGGIWQSENILDDNPNWQELSAEIPNLSVCAIEQLDDKIVFGTGEGYFNSNSFSGAGLYAIESDDQISHFSSTGSTSFQYIQDIITSDNGNLLVATKNNGIQYSANHGVSWKKVLGTGEGASVNSANKIRKFSDGQLVASMGIQEQGGVYFSDDHGLNWDKRMNGLPISDFSRIEIAVSASNKNTVYALIANGNGSAVKGLYKTKNKGLQWYKMTTPNAYSMSEFTRGQAWYNLAISVSPTNPNRLIVGGIDLFASRNGGLSFEQISHYSGNYGLNKVHADQHTIKFINDTDALIGNDGGVFLIEDVFDWSRSITAKNEGLNITQFYGCDIHPIKDEYIAGSQDNGTQKFTSDNFSKTEEITGGDGAYCHYNQVDSDIQITSYIHNNYFVSTNGGETFQYTKFNNDGLFANPSYYNSPINTFYAADRPGFIFRWSKPGLDASSYRSIYVSNMSNAQVTFITGSKNDNNRLFVGTIGGDVYKIDHASTANYYTATKLYSGPDGHAVSCIDSEEGDEAHLIMSFSNYGVNSIFETKNFGKNWTSCQGNLPDMPVRWAMLDPQNSDGAILGTELGIWYTADLDGSRTQWIHSSTGMPHVRVDMIKYRASDDKLVAATHGRGLFISSIRSDEEPPVVVGEPVLSLSHDHEEIKLSEQSVNGTKCDGAGHSIELNFELNRPATEELRIPIEVDHGNSSDSDLNLVNNYIFFEEGQQFAKVHLELFDDNVVEDLEYLKIRINESVVSLESPSSISIEIEDNDEALITESSSTADAEFTIGTATDASFEFPFKGYYEDQKTQIILTAAELRASNMKEGLLSGLKLLVETKKSDIPFNDFTIFINHVSANQTNSIGEEFFDEGIEVFANDFETSVGWNDFQFTTAFEWDGVSNIVLQFCFNNNDWSYNDQVACTATDDFSVQYQYADSNKGCSLSNIRALSKIRPVVKFYQGVASDINIANNLVEDASGIGPYESAYFVDGSNNIIARLENNSAHDLGCVSVSIDQTGSGYTCSELEEDNCVANKTFRVDVENEHPYTLEIFYTTAELSFEEDMDYRIYQSETSVFDDNLDRFIEGADLQVEMISENVMSASFDTEGSHGFALSHQYLDQKIILSNDDFEMNTLEFYPNPFQTEFHCKISRGMEGKFATILLYNMEGQIIYSWREVLHRGMVLQVPEHVPTGTYLMKTTTETGDQVQQKMVKN